MTEFSPELHRKVLPEDSNMKSWLSENLQLKTAGSSSLDEILQKASLPEQLIKRVSSTPGNHYSNYQPPEWIYEKCRTGVVNDNFKITDDKHQENPFKDLDIDPGFSGGRTKIETSLRQEAKLEHFLLEGNSYADSRRKAGLAPETDSGFCPFEGQNAKAQAVYNRELRSGTDYQTARKIAGLGQDRDPGFHGGEKLIEWRDCAYAWLKEYLRQGHNLCEAEAQAIKRIGPYPYSSNPR